MITIRNIKRMKSEVIEKFLKSKQKKSIFVCGDAMYDEYYEVDAERVSPEFPIPVMMSRNSKPTSVMPGGAANVANQFKHFKHKFDVKFYGYVDAEFDSLLYMNDIDSKVTPLHGLALPKKKRLYCNKFPLCRWDIEDDFLGKQVKGFKLDMVKSNLYHSKPDIVIFSDYNKGTFDYPSRWCEIGSDVFKIVDPKNDNLLKWRGCNLFKPNKKEAYDLSGETDWKKQCDFFQEKLGCDYVVITHGAEGVKIKAANLYFEYIPEDEIDAESVIGAGDCFVAFLAMGIASDLDIVESSTLAFEAGKLYVQNKYNKPVSPLELLDSLDCKFLDSPEMLANRSFNLVYTNGVFDVLHAGHVELLKHAKSKGDRLVVALNTDESVKTLNKGTDRPINNLADRISVLSALDYVDYIVVFDETTPIKTINAIKPDLIVKGGDYSKETVVGGDLFPVHIFPLYKDLSSTKMIKYGS